MCVASSGGVAPGYYLVPLQGTNKRAARTTALRRIAFGREAAFVVRVFSAPSRADQIRARGSEGMLTRSTIKPSVGWRIPRRSCRRVRCVAQRCPSADGLLCGSSGPSPVFRAADQTGPHRVKVNVLDLFVVFPDAAQGAVEACPEPSRREPGLPQFAVRAPALVDRA
jgi:hypothetical protein